jgi:hypothetical protein
MGTGHGSNNDSIMMYGLKQDSLSEVQNSRRRAYSPGYSDFGATAASTQ